MLKYYIEDYEMLKDHLDQEIKRFPQKEQELIEIYAPAINYHACRFAEQLREDRKMGLKYETI